MAPKSPEVKVEIRDRAILDAVAQALRDLREHYDAQLALQDTKRKDVVDRQESIRENLTGLAELIKALQEAFDASGETTKELVETLWGEITTQLEDFKAQWHADAVERDVGHDAIHTTLADRISGLQLRIDGWEDPSPAVAMLKSRVDAVAELITELAHRVTGYEELETRVNNISDRLVDYGDQAAAAETAETVQKLSADYIATQAMVSEAFESTIERIERFEERVSAAADVEDAVHEQLGADIKAGREEAAARIEALRDDLVASEEQLAERLAGIDERREQLADELVAVALHMEEQPVALSKVREELIAELGKELREAGLRFKALDESSIEHHDRLEAIDERQSRTLDEIENGLQQEDARRRELEQTLVAKLEDAETRVSAAIKEAIDKSGAEVQVRLDDLRASAAAETRSLGERLEATGEKLEARIAFVEQEREAWHRQHLVAEDWSAGQAPYKQGATVKHRGGLWQAQVLTAQEPGEAGHWSLLVDGLHRLMPEKVSDRAFRLRGEFACGRSYVSESFVVPHPTPKGVWEHDAEYDWLDIVLDRGCQYQAIKDKPTGRPSDSDDWVLTMKRGQRGSRGPKGEPGEVPPIEKFFDSWLDYLNIGDGTPLLRFRGAWEPRKDFRPGDLISFEGSLYLATIDIPASFEPPTHVDRKGWVLIMASRRGAGGGGGGGRPVVDIIGRPGFGEGPTAADPDKGIVNPTITQARVTQADMDAAIADSLIEPGRLYHVTDDDSFHLGVTANTTKSFADSLAEDHAGLHPMAAHVPAGGSAEQVLGKVDGSDYNVQWVNVDVNTVGESIPGTGAVEDDVNGHYFSGPDADGAGRLCIGSNTIAYIGHDGVVYRYFGPRERCIGLGGAGGTYPHYTTTSADWVSTGSTDHQALTNRDVADTHPQAAIGGRGAHATLEADQIAQDAEIALRMTNLIDDPDPYVGGDLKVGGADNYVISFTDVLGVEAGAAGYDPAYGAFLARTIAGEYDWNDGGLVAAPGKLELHGASIIIDQLKHENSAGLQLYISDEGILFGVDPPLPGWSDTGVDAGTYDLGTGTGLGTWVQLTGTAAVVQEDVADGDEIIVQATVYAVNKTASRTGAIAIGYGIGGSPPTGDGFQYAIAGGLAGFLPPARFTVTDHGGLLTGQTVTIWGRLVSGSHGQFGVDLDGTTNNHELRLSVPSGSGGGGGAPTNLDNVPGPNSVQITSSTGTNTTIDQAQSGGDAGVLSGADKAKLDSLSTTQVTAPERIAGTELAVRQFSPEDVAVMAGLHHGAITAVVDDTSPQLGGNLAGAGNEIQNAVLADYAEKANDLGATINTTQELDVAAGMVHHGTMVGDTTFSFAATSHVSTSFTLLLATGGYSPTFTGVTWAGAAPDLSADATYLLAFFFIAGTWYGVLAG